MGSRTYGHAPGDWCTGSGQISAYVPMQGLRPCPDCGRWLQPVRGRFPEHKVPKP